VIHDVWPGDPSRFVSQRLLGAESVKLAQDDILEDATRRGPALPVSQDANYSNSESYSATDSVVMALPSLATGQSLCRKD
jgi:hypothetical protein